MSPEPAAFRAAEAAYLEARTRLEEHPTAPTEVEDVFLAAAHVVDRTPVATWGEFADAIEIACDGGDSVPCEDVIFKLLADARRLNGGVSPQLRGISPRTSEAIDAGPSSGWADARSAYLAALAAELAYDAVHINPFVKPKEDSQLGCDTSAVAAVAWPESERLMDVRCDAEDVLMGIPSPSAEGFALKFLIAHGGGREANGWNDMLEAEARLLAPEFPQATP